jgi:hypothetical protein
LVEQVFNFLKYTLLRLKFFCFESVKRQFYFFYLKLIKISLLPLCILCPKIAPQMFRVRSIKYLKVFEVKNIKSNLILPSLVFISISYLSPYVLLCFRYAHTGDVVARYLAYVRQRFAAVFLCVLHLWHCRRSTVGRNSASEVLSKAIAQHQLSTVSTASHSVRLDLFLRLYFCQRCELPSCTDV